MKSKSTQAQSAENSTTIHNSTADRRAPDSPMRAAATHQHAEQGASQRLSVNLDYRLGVFDEASPRALADAVDGMTDRAHAVLTLLSGQFSDPDVGRFNDNIICNALESVIFEIQDIKTIVDAYFEASVATEESAGGV